MVMVYPPVCACVAAHAVAAKTTCAVTTVTATAPIMSNNEVYPSPYRDIVLPVHLPKLRPHFDIVPTARNIPDMDIIPRRVRPDQHTPCTWYSDIGYSKVCTLEAL